MERRLQIQLLYSLFRDLRDRLGMELDLRQYQLLLTALQRGIGADPDGHYDHKSLLGLCKTLWLTHDHYKKGFEQAFLRWLEMSEKTWTPLETQAPPSPAPRPPGGGDSGDGNEKLEVRGGPDEEQNTLPPPMPEQPEPVPPMPGPAPGSAEPIAANLQEWEVSFEAIEAGYPGAEEVEPDGSTLSHQFVLNNHYLPLSGRKLQHQCRYLRYRAEKRPGRVLDATATVRATAAAGGFPQLRYTHNRYYTERFVVFIDRGPGMAAFDKLAGLFVASLTDGLGLGGEAQRLQQYYFNEVPRQWIYTDAHLTRSIPWEQALGRLRSSDLVFVLSDAGSATRRRDQERASLTLTWVQQIQQKTRHVLWLNPLPTERWGGSAASYVPLLTTCIPMRPNDFLHLPALLRHL